MFIVNSLPPPPPPPIFLLCFPSFFLALVTNLCSCNIVNSCYRYTGDLLALEATATGRGPAPFVSATPLKPTAWQNYLVSHPDQCFAQYISFPSPVNRENGGSLWTSQAHREQALMTLLTPAFALSAMPP